MIAAGLMILTCVFTLASLQLLLINGFSTILIATGITSLVCLIVVLISSWRTGKQLDQETALGELKQTGGQRLREMEHRHIQQRMDQRECAPESFQENQATDQQQDSL